MANPTHIPNEHGSHVLYVATEDTPGVAKTPTARMLGDAVVTKTINLSRTEDMTGGYDRMSAPKQELPTFAGTYAEDMKLTFESAPQLARWWIKGGGAGTTDGNATPGYTYAKSPTFSVDDVDFFTAQYGVNGLGYQSSGNSIDEGTITLDATSSDNAWGFSSNLFAREKIGLPGWTAGIATAGATTTLTMTGATWTVNALIGQFVFFDAGSHTGQVRMITANTATQLTWLEPLTTAVAAGTIFRVEAAFPVGIAVPSNEIIPVAGSKIFIDNYNAVTPTIGTTQVMDRLISASVTVANNRKGKRFVENTSAISTRTGRGGRLITGQIRLENDRRDEELNWEQMKEVSIRILQTGSVIDATAGSKKSIQIDIPRALWETPSYDTRDNNDTVTYGFLAFLPATAPILTLTAKNKLATLA